MTPISKEAVKSKKIKECGVMEHDFKHLKRFGRADWRCPKCGNNVMLLLVFAQQSGIDLTEL